MKYDAITLDTSIFERNGLRLESGLLAQMIQFKDSYFPFILSEIVYRELSKHLVEKVNEANSQSKKALKLSVENAGLSPDQLKEIKEILISPKSAEEIVKDRLDAYLLSTGAEIVGAGDNTNIADLLDLYFNVRAPFEDSGTKKNEFPDAAALLSLEGWGKKHNKKIIAVSADKGWMEYAKTSAYVDVSDDLSAVISEFQPINKAVNTINLLSSTLLRRSPHALSKKIHESLSQQIHSLSFDAEGHSSYYTEPSDIVEVEFRNFEYLTDSDDNIDYKIVFASENRVIIAVDLLVDSTASCDFSLSMYDSVDKDYVPMGRSSNSMNYEFEVEALLHLSGSFTDNLDEVELSELEVISHPSTIDFGDIEPDWWHDEPEV